MENKKKDRASAFEEAIKEINKKYNGEGIQRVKDMERADVKTFSSNCFSLDYVFGCGGIPRGRIIEIFGMESSGKSTLALYLIAQIQKTGGKAVFVDAEFAFKADYARSIGVNVGELYVSQPTTGEEALDVVRKVIESNGADIVVVDSVASLVPAKELEAELDKDSMALQARMMSKALRILTGSVAKSQTIVIFINQIREKVGVYFGNKNTTSGGKALKFYSSVRLEVKKGEKIKGKDDEVIGNWLKICAVKNKVGVPWREADIEIVFARGIDTNGDILDTAERQKVIIKSGNSYILGEKRVVGRDQAKRYLDENPKYAEEIKKKLIIK